MRSLLKRGLKVLKRGVTQKKEVGSIELYDSGSSSPGAFFLLLVDLGSGAAVSGMRIEINTGCQKASRVEGGGSICVRYQ